VRIESRCQEIYAEDGGGRFGLIWITWSCRFHPRIQFFM